jgi:CheY-like chemotaxis protein
MNPLPPILVAEDDDDDFHFLRRAAREANVENPILRFRDGLELTKFLESAPIPKEQGAPWLLLLDLSMPMMTGFEVLQWLSDHAKRPQVRPVILSGFYHPADVERSRALGATEYVVKPIKSETVALLASRPVPVPA